MIPSRMAWTKEQTSNGEAEDPSSTAAMAVVTVQQTAAPEADAAAHPNDSNKSSKELEIEDERRRQVRTEKRLIITNMAVVCLSFFMSMTAFSGLANLQTSLNSKSGQGHTALTIVFFVPVVSSVLVASTAVRLLGYKRSMVVGLLVTCAFPAANFYPTAEVLYTGAAITGLAGGIMWSSHGGYVTALGKRYAALDGAGTSQSVISRFFGTYFTTHRMSMVVGSLVSSLIFRRPDEANHLPPDVVGRICGSSYCYQDLDASHWTTIRTIANDTNLSLFVNDTVAMAAAVADAACNDTLPSPMARTVYRPSSLQLNSLYAIYVSCCLLAPLVLLVFLRQPAEPLEDPDHRQQGKDEGTGGGMRAWTNVKTTLANLVDYRMILLLPIMILHGWSQSFIVADYCVGFISCTVGIDSIGYVMATFGLTSALTAFCSGVLIKYTGRQALFFFAAVWTLATLVAMWQWTPSSSQPEVLYAFAALWGVCTTVWQTQLISYVGFLFRNESPQPAMAAYYTVLNTSIGSWFLGARYLCLHSQLHLLMLMLSIGMVGYMAVEILVRRAEKKVEGQAKQATGAPDVVTGI